MWSDVPLFPEQASTIAGSVDALFLFLIALSAFFGILIASVLVFFAVRFHRRDPDERGVPIHGSLALELTWSLIPLGIVLLVFVWSADIYFRSARVPKNAIEINVVGKRWMWKIQHMSGQREINELHVPVGTPVKLSMTSEDVIHSFFVPAFRVKKDVVPGRYNTAWFEVTRPGRYRLFCTEYCGTKHSEMIGWVIAMEPSAFQEWLAGGPQGGSLASAGEKLFQELACITCHQQGDTGRGPSLVGIFGTEITLQDGTRVVVDESYVRESIVAPASRITQGYQPIMPTFQGLVSEENLMSLVAYVKSLGEEGARVAVPGSGEATDAAAAAAQAEGR